MWTLIEDIFGFAKELWFCWVPGVIVGVMLGFFLAYWPVVVILSVSALIVAVVAAISIGVSGPNAGEGGGIVLLFLGVLCLGVFLGLGSTAVFVDTIHVSWIPMPSMDINFDWLFRQR